MLTEDQIDELNQLIDFYYTQGKDIHTTDVMNILHPEDTPEERKDTHGLESRQEGRT